MAKGDKLTPKQIKYCQYRAKGESQRNAYKKAGYSTRQEDSAIDCNAYQLERIQKIKEKIAELQTKADNNCILTTEQRKQALTDIYIDNTQSTKDRLKALDLLNRMSGDYIEKKEISANIGLSRNDRLDAMNDMLESLKKAWNDSSVEE